MTSLLLAFIPARTACLANVWLRMDAATREYIAIFGSLGLLTVLALVWAVYFRRRHRHHHHHHHSAPNANAEPAREKGRRRRRREHRPRNPTLAETGGMPPVREEESSDPQP